MGQHLYHTETTSFTGLDEPNTTSPVTYHIQVGSYFHKLKELFVLIQVKN